MKTQKQIEKELTEIYTTAHDELSEKWNAYMDSVQPECDKLYDRWQEAIKTGDKDLISETEKAYREKLDAVTIRSTYYRDMISQTSTELANVNEVALAYANGLLPDAYCTAYNEIEGALNDLKISITFNLADPNTVRNMVMNNGKSLLPYRKLDIGKDKRWSTKLLNSQITQGIIQGESIPKIAKRLENVVGMEKKASIRNARTMMTSAENKGRMDSYERATEMGIVMMKVWQSAIDERTRLTHLELDGQEADIDEPFRVDEYEIMYPCDPDCKVPEMIYNCRCTLKTRIKGYRNSDGTINLLNSSLHDNGSRVVRDYSNRERYPKGQSVKVSYAESQSIKQNLIDGKKIKK